MSRWRIRSFVRFCFDVELELELELEKSGPGEQKGSWEERRTSPLV